jgi:hypothetical protein
VICAGYILTVQDVSEGIERSRRRDALLQTLTEKLRAAVGAIRAASETVESYPEMAPAQRQRFQQVIHDEAAALSTQIDNTLRAYASDLRAPVAARGDRCRRPDLGGAAPSPRTRAPSQGRGRRSTQPCGSRSTATR